MFHVVRMRMKRFTRNYSRRQHDNTACCSVYVFWSLHKYCTIQYDEASRWILNWCLSFFVDFVTIFNDEILLRQMVRRWMIDELERICKEAVMRKTSKNLGVAPGPSTIRNEHLLNESLWSYLTSSPAYSANRYYNTLLLLLYYLTFFIY
jgi:hypothetical protein